MAAERRVRNLAPARGLRLELAVQALERFADGRPLSVLDAGCQVGLLTTRLAQRQPQWRLVGADIDEQSLATARLWAAEARAANVRFQRVDMTRDPPGEVFDAVAAIECLAEIPDDDAALRFMVQSLKPGGLLVTHVPERDWRPVLSGSRATWTGERRHGYSRDELSGKLGAAGFVHVEVRETTRTTVHLAEELRDRIKHRSLKTLAAAYPLMRAAVRLERAGVTWGSARGLLAVARRPTAVGP